MVESFDVVIVGGGPAGEHAAGRACAAGLSVALVESELVGGECTYWACMPSKTLLRPGQSLAEVRSVPGAAAAVSGELDVAAALARRDWMVSSWHDDGQVRWLEGVGATLVRGEGRLDGERRVVVEGSGGRRELTAERAVLLAVGSQSAVPPIPGIEDARYWTNREATAAESVPERLVVLGGGVVGVELAEAFRRLGSREVTVVEGGERLVATNEPFVSELLAKRFADEGIAVRTGARVVGVAREGEVVRLTLEDGTVVEGDELLVATGRRPRTAGIGLESVGLTGGHYLPTDGQMRVEGVEGGWLYAIGDTNGKALLTHMGKYQARVAVDTVLGEEFADEADQIAVTGVIFTDPEIATVGLTEAGALGAGIAASTVAVDLTEIPAGAIWGEGIVGRCQLVIDDDRQVVVGATFVGPAMAESLEGAAIAIVGEVPMRRLRHAVPCFPSLAEIWLELIERYLAGHRSS